MGAVRLHYKPGSAAMAPHAALAELGVDYELVLLENDDRGQIPPEYLALNPWGRVPTLEDGDLVLTESAAILLHLADRFPDAGLAPAPGTAARSQLYRRLIYLTNTVQPGFLRLFYPERYTSDPAGEDAIRALEAETLELHFDRLEAELAEREWLVPGDRHTVADLFLFMLIRWGRRLEPPAWDRPALRGYALRMLELPGVRRMMDEQGLELPELTTGP
jgi:glutathione S-transferase